MTKKARELATKKNDLVAKIKEHSNKLETKGEDFNFETFEKELNVFETELKEINIAIKAEALVGIDLEKKIEKKEGQKMEKTDVLRSVEYKENYFKHLKGKMSIEALELKFGSSVITSMGAAIPTTTFEQIISKLEQHSTLFNEATIYNIQGNLRLVVEDESEDAVVHVEGAELSEENLTLDPIDFLQYEVAKLVSISKTVETQSINDLEAFITDEISRKLAVKVEKLMATGTGANQPTGVLVSALITNEKTLSAIDYAGIISVIGALPTMYHKNAKFYMDRLTYFSNIIGLTDNEGQPIFKLGSAQEGVMGTILGYDVVITDYFPNFDAALATDKVFVFGDFAYGYRGNFGMPATIEKSYESSFRKGLVDYRGCLIFDSKVVLGEAFVRVVKGA